MYNKKTYLIDSENVGIIWKKLLSIKEKKDRIIVFYTDKSPNISYSDLLDIIKYPDSFETIKCNQGKNGLDFQLVSYLGYLLKSAPKTDYFIVSKDTGFDCVCKFWNEMDLGYSVRRTDLEKLPGTEEKALPASQKKTAETPKAAQSSEPQKSKKETDSISIIESVIPKDYASETDLPKKIFKLIKSNDISQLQQLYTAFTKSLGQGKGIEIYRAMKPHLKEIV